MPLPHTPITAQQAFDLAVNGVRAQNYVRSTKENDFSCVYRASNGRKCAVGHMLPDDLYDPAMDEESLVAGSVLARYPAVGAFFVNVPYELLEDLQESHDAMYGQFAAGKFEQRVKHAAEKFNLVYTPPAA